MAARWANVAEVVEASVSEVVQHLKSVDVRYDVSRRIEDDEGDADERDTDERARNEADFIAAFLPSPLETRIAALLEERQGGCSAQHGGLRDPTVCMVVEGLLRAHSMLRYEPDDAACYAHCPTGANLVCNTRNFVYVVRRDDAILSG